LFKVVPKYQSRSEARVSFFRDCASFYGELLSAPRPTPKLEDHPLSAVRNCLFNIFTATLHTGGRSSIRNPKTRHAVVTGTPLPCNGTNMEMNIHVCVSECIYPAEFPLLFSGATGVAARKMPSPIRPVRFYFRNCANILHIHLYINL
jgi:hypothetical protein